MIYIYIIYIYIYYEKVLIIIRIVINIRITLTYIICLQRLTKHTRKNPTPPPSPLQSCLAGHAVDQKLLRLEVHIRLGSAG